ncbi:MAG: C25 family cysteine peptidase [Pseudomonadota bacterium]
MIAPLLLCALAAASPTGSLWLGDVRLGDAPPLAAGPHLGAPVRIGDRVLQPTWQPGAPAALMHGGKDDDLGVRPELLVLTTAALAGGSALLPRFLDLREAEGFSVDVATEADWDSPVDAGPDTRADRIRAYLQERYLDDPGAFLLLIGDPDPDAGDVPMTWVHPLQELAPYFPDWLAAELEPVPTDWLYADLSGDWDCDGDGRFGEHPDDAGEGCVDFGPELIVGRLPVYGGDVSALDDLLERAIARDLEQDKSYRSSVLLPGALFGVVGAPSPMDSDYEENDDGACILDRIAADLPAPWSEQTLRLYEDSGLVTSPYPHDGALSGEAVRAAWAEGRGLVVWAGHGSDTGVFRMIWLEDADGDGRASVEEMAYPAYMESRDTADLADAGGAFTFHVSCDNGFPEVPDNLGTALLSGGAAGTATASRPSIGMTAPFGEEWEPRPDLATSADAAWTYAMALTAGWTVGEALAWTKAALPGDGWGEETWGWDYTGYAWITKTEYNLYGDPTRSLELCDSAADCDDGSPCDGVEDCVGGYCVHSDPVDCAGLDDACTVGRCDDAGGGCVAEARVDGAPCDDGAWCTEGDTCEAGVCGGYERDCGEREGWEVWCDEEAQACASEPIADTDEEEPRGGCASAPGPRSALVALLGLLALAWRRPRAAVR